MQQQRDLASQNYFKKALDLVCGFLLMSLVFSYLFQFALIAVLPQIRYFVSSLFPSMNEQLNDTFWLYLISSLSSIFAMAFPFYLLAKRLDLPIKKTLAWGKVTPTPVVRGSLAGLGANYTFSLIAAALIALLERQGIQSNSPDFTMPSSLLAQISYVVCICVVAPIMEEYVFRGVVLQTLRPFGNTFAIVFSAAMFSFLHGNLNQIPSTFAAGLIMGYMAVSTGSLTTAILIHFVNNTFSTVVGYISGWEIENVSAVLGFLAIGLMVYFIYFAATFKSKKVATPDFYYTPKKVTPILRSVLFWALMVMYTAQLLLSFQA